MTPNTILTEIRAALNDGDPNPANQRWIDSILLQYMWEGENKIVNRHPESQYVTYVGRKNIVLLTANTQSFTLADSWSPALVHYVCYRALSEDAEDSQNAGAAALHMKAFEAII